MKADRFSEFGYRWERRFGRKSGLLSSAAMSTGNMTFGEFSDAYAALIRENYNDDASEEEGKEDDTIRNRD